jgi:crotonobetainyl-CoA:carnitine CoA-transferase CaiB-like acyl-CoA transferase
MPEGILDGVRIVDMTTGIAGPVATMLLAEVGADVVKIEGPTPGRDREQAGFRTWNRSKRSAIVDLDRPEGRARLESMLAGADVFVHELGPTAASALGLDDDALAERHPDLIVSSVLSWPANHPDADRPVDELLAMARLGICDEQMPWHRDGPVLIRFPLGSWGAVYLAAAGIVARLIARGRTGIAGPAHTSLVAGALVPMGMHWSRADHPSEGMRIGFPKEGRGSQATIYECRDGHWFHLMGNPMQSPMVQRIIPTMGDGPDALIKTFLAAPRQEWLDDLWANDVPAQPCLPFGDIFDDEQSLANEYIVELDDPEHGHITVGGKPLTVTPPQAVRGPAPAHGAHTDEVLAGWTARPLRTRGTNTRYPLEGVKVLDLGAYLAGPYAPMLLADLGATVIKIESTTGDAMRPTGWAFNGCQRGKFGVALDLKAPSARAAVEAAIRWADVVHHNIRMPAARRLGIDPESVRAINPDVVFCHTSSYGPAGPRADWPGYDQLFQAQCGWEVLGAGEGNTPMWHRFGFMDHQCALSSVVTTLLALYRRDQTGVGTDVAGSLLGAGALTVSETFVKPDGTLVPFASLDTDQREISEGRRIVELDDGWVAVAADTPAQLDALRGIALNGRKVADALADLGTAGVPAEHVREDQRDPFFDDPANRAAHLVASYPHAEFGAMLQPGAMWWFRDQEVKLEMAPPALGEHTVACLTEIGLDRATIDGLLAEGAAVQFVPAG